MQMLTMSFLSSRWEGLSLNNTLQIHMKIRVGILRAVKISFRLSGEMVAHVAELRGEDIILDGNIVDTNDTYIHNGSRGSSVLTFGTGNNAMFTLDDVVIGISFHWERTEKQNFMGQLTIVKDADKLVAINEIDVEDYLLSVISSEMNATASMELLKAHAVISRSWVIGRLKAKQMRTIRPTYPTPQYRTSDTTYVKWYDTEEHALFDVCADDHCQRYQGVNRAKERKDVWTKVQLAVDATRGEVLTYNGELCDARFSKCCGGVTELFENCWEYTPKPYLVAKQDFIADDIRSAGVVCAFCNTADTRILRQVLNGYDLETRDFYRWEVRYTPDELRMLLLRKSDIDFGRIIALEPVLRGPSYRIIQLRIVGEKRTVIVGKELEIRKWLSESHLYSSAFDVEHLPDGSFILHGRGWGHGVGLCQIGAAVMAEKGYAYHEILKHYYPGTALSTIDTNP